MENEHMNNVGKYRWALAYGAVGDNAFLGSTEYRSTLPCNSNVLLPIPMTKDTYSILLRNHSFFRSFPGPFVKFRYWVIPMTTHIMKPA